jgi:hypothetical protein
VYFSLYMAATGLTGAACTFLGGHLSVWLAPWGGFRALWVVGVALRLSVVWLLIPRLEGRWAQRKTPEGSSLGVNP